MSADIQISTTLPAAHEMGQRLNTVSLTVMRKYAAMYRKDWRARWENWVYKGRPAKAPRLVSNRAWKATASPTDTGAVLSITNEARDWRTKSESYVAHVHRSGTPPEDVEWLKVRVDQAAGIDREFFADLASAVALGAGPKSRRVVGPRGSSETVTARGSVL